MKKRQTMKKVQGFSEEELRPIMYDAVVKTEYEVTYMLSDVVNFSFTTESKTFKTFKEAKDFYDMIGATYRNLLYRSLKPVSKYIFEERRDTNVKG